MMATCKCKTCGHTWTTPIIEDDPTINSFVLQEDQCPECNGIDYDILDIDYTDPFLD